MMIIPFALTTEQVRFPIAGIFIALGAAKIWRDGVLWTKTKRIVGTPAKIIASVGFAIAFALIIGGLFFSEPESK